MHVFLSYASEDRQLAEQIQLSLIGDGHTVFFDQESLPAGGDYQKRIRDAVKVSDCFVFLISPDSVAPRSFALTELGYARELWPHPKERVIPVLLRNINWDTIPNYLKAVTILEPKGNLAAEIVSAIAKLGPPNLPFHKNDLTNTDQTSQSNSSRTKANKFDYTKNFLIILIPLFLGGTAPLFVANWFVPEFLRFDVFFPTKEVEILDDFVFVHFERYKDRESEQSIETYSDPCSEQQSDTIFDKATYMEHMWTKKTVGKYTIHLATTGIAPEIKTISPPIKEPKCEKNKSGNKIITAELALDQIPESTNLGSTPNPKLIFVYRNWFQKRNSFGGKNVTYDTDHLTFVYNFSSLENWKNLFQIAPQACLKRVQEEQYTNLPLIWANGVAITEARALRKADKVRIFWTWNRLISNATPFQPVTCDDALR